MDDIKPLFPKRGRHLRCYSKALGDMDLKLKNMTKCNQTSNNFRARENSQH